MNYKQGPRRLGKSKNSSISKEKPIQIHRKWDSTSQFRHNNQFEQMQNQHRHIMTHDGSFMPQRLKQNETRVLCEIPDNSAYLSRTGDSVYSFKSPYQKYQNNRMEAPLCQKQVQLLQKNRVLEQRISELHAQKQSILLRHDLEAKRLREQNNVLRSQLQNQQLLKNKQIQCLRQELQLKYNRKQNWPVPLTCIIQQNGMPQQIQTPTWQHKQVQILQNEKEKEKVENISTISIEQYIGKEFVKTSVSSRTNSNELEVRKWKQANEVLEEKNRRYQEQMQKIVEEYLVLDSKYKQLDAQMQKMRIKIHTQQTLIKNSQPQQPQHTKQQLKKLESQNNLYKKMLQQKSDQVDRLKEQHHNQLKFLSDRKNRLTQSLDEIVKKVAELQTKLKQLQSCKSIQVLNVGAQTQGAGACLKCKELSKAVVRLNQCLYNGHGRM